MREGRCCLLWPAVHSMAWWGLAGAVVAALWLGGSGTSLAQAPPAAVPPAPVLPVIGLGQPLPADEIARYVITVFPDGRNLPPGRGSVEQGARLYAMHCAACHGAKGIEGPAARLAGTDGFIDWNDPLRPLRVRKYPLQVLSVGALWPYATTVFDYVRRGMPLHAPKSLTDDEVYAITAHLLHLNGLVPASAVMDPQSLPRVVMPGKGRTVSAWPMDR